MLHPRRILPGLLLATTLLASLALPGAPARAQEHASGKPAEPGQASPNRRNPRPTNSLGLLGGSADAWSVSKTVEGCFLLSPAWGGSSRVAVGVYPGHGLGLLAVSFPISVRADLPLLRVGISLGATDMQRDGTMVDTNLLFVPLTPEEAETVLATIQSRGELWISVRGVSIEHQGQAAATAVPQFRSACLTPAPNAGTGPGGAAAAPGTQPIAAGPAQATGEGSKP